MENVKNLGLNSKIRSLRQVGKRITRYIRGRRGSRVARRAIERRRPNRETAFVKSFFGFLDSRFHELVH